MTSPVPGGPVPPPDWPVPDADARAHSRLLAEAIGAAIDAAGGWLAFETYLDLALYAPGLGYYSAGATRFGPAGDFVTAPELGSAFAGSLARVARRLAADLPEATILEFGAGSGALAADLLTALADAPPRRYAIVEVSADLRVRQRALLADRVPQLLHRVVWLDGPPAAPVDGLVIANEVLDALPFRCFRTLQAGLVERGVGRTDRGFGWAERPPDPAFTALLGAAVGHAVLPPGFVGELRPRATPWIAAVTASLGRGLALLIDYGGTRRELYHPGRAGGSLRCHYRQRAHDDPFLWPGLQDITAWVDFSAAADAARRAGADIVAYGTQAHFLLANGILTAAAPASAAGRARLSHELGRLLLPGELGERFKVLVLGRAAPAWAADLVMRDLRPTLA